MKFLPTILGLASVANAHTLFTTLFINGKNQGDGTCVRQPANGDGKGTPSANAPIYPLTGDDMACGRLGNTAANYVCPAPGGARLTFEFRMSPSRSNGGAIAEGHKGPCSVYIKKVDDMFSTKAAGPGWFKIWEDGYNTETNTWCVDTLIKNKGLLTVDLPTGLPSGYYLIRPEVLALHSAHAGDPQFYTSCAQVFIENGPEGPLNIPSENSVSIPGYIKADDPGVTFNIYKKPIPEYPIPGPEVYIPTSSSTGSKQVQEDGVIPSDCLAKSANWCGKPIASFSGQAECWAAAKECWAQGDVCWKSQTPSGNANCKTWGDYCKKMNDACSNKQFDGPLQFTAKEIMEPVPGPIPVPYNNFKRTEISGGGNSGSGSDTSNNKPVVSSAVASSVAVSSAPIITVTTKSATKTAAAAEKTDKPTKPEEVNAPSLPTGAQETDAASPTSVVSPAKTSSPTEDGLNVSQDGRCGGTTGQTCLGSSFGDCCSKKGFCGRKTRHCACGCQPGFGDCRK